MKALEFHAEVLPDGHLSLPNRARKEAGLRKGSSVRVLLLPDEDDVEDRFWAGRKSFIREMREARRQDLEGRGIPFTEVKRKR